ncbi:MAG: histidinol dehydrogenase [Paracoccaceae bacterium]
MPHLLATSDPDFAQAFDSLLGLREASQPAVDQVVSGIIADVRMRGVQAVLELTETFDRLALTPDTVALSKAEMAAEIAKVPTAERDALQQAADRIRAYHERQLPTDADWTDETGTRLGWRWTPVDRAGLYVPGGLASYPSSVLMNAIPAQVAGVRDLIICAPTPDGAINPLVILAAQLGGVSRIFRIGGAQAIAAMAYGAAPVPSVDVITGPGNAYVAEAKRQVFGRVGIDMIAGPSEVLVIADANNDPDWIALDLMAQAEHDAEAQAILITNDAGFALAVNNAINARLETLERAEIAGASWRDYGAIITVANMAEAPALANRIAPEHLEILTADPEALLSEIRHAGAVFLGQYTPEAIGDYVGGPNHVLPTSGSARFSSGLSVLDFMKRTTVSALSPAALRAVGPAAATLARSESLEAHALSVERRLATLN